MRPGDRICEEYTLVRPLGRGAFGDVWLANQDRLRREVALKFAMSSLLDGVAGGPARFAQEAILHGQLDHRHIVPLFDARSHDGAPFLVMPFLRGGSLADKAERLTTADLVRHGVAVCDALAYAHKRHVIHRDIKPMNLLLDDDGEVRVADFGIARLLDEVNGSSATRATVAGTEGFAAPEQLRGDRVDLRVDVYGLGATLVYLATGRSPIDLITLKRGALLSLVDPAIRSVVDKMTREEPQDRYSGAAQARDALRAALTAPARPSGAPRAASPPKKEPSAAVNPEVPRFVVSVPRGAAPSAARTPPSAERLPAQNLAIRTIPSLPTTRMESFFELWLIGLLWVPIAIAAAWVVWQVVSAGAGSPTTTTVAKVWSGQSGYVMTLVPAGTYEVGSPRSELGHGDDERQHLVTLTQAYWVGRSEVTQSLWASVAGAGANPSHSGARLS